jgi:hypothetical protein
MTIKNGVKVPMPYALGNLPDWLGRPSGLPNVGHSVAATLFTWPLDFFPSNPRERPYDTPYAWAYTGQATLPSFAVLAGLDADIMNDNQYGLYIPRISADGEGAVPFADGLALTYPDPQVFGVVGTLTTPNPLNPNGEPVYGFSADAGQVVQLEFQATFQIPGEDVFPHTVLCKLILSESAQYIGPQPKVIPINQRV